MQTDKNLLQEYAAQRQRLAPLYTTRRCGGPDHAPLWQCTVQLWDQTVHEGGQAPTKVDAEQSAARLALQRLHAPAPPVQGPMRTALLVDVENKPKLLYQLSEEQLERVTVYAFVGEHHALVDKPLPAGVVRIASPSSRPDGTDTCMQVYVGFLLGQRAFSEYVVATGDHFGPVLVEMIQTETLLWPACKARHVTHPKQV